MKKNILLWLLAIVPFFSFSQGVKANLYDKFIKQHRVETEPFSFTGLIDKARLSMTFTALGSTIYLTVSGAGWGTATVDSDNELKLLLSNDSVVTLKSTALQGLEPGMLQNTYRHQYHVAANQLDALTKYNLVSIRKYSFATFTDLDIPQQNTAKLKRLTSLFVEELKKANILRSFHQISVKDIRNHIGDSVEFCSKVYKTRYFEESAEGPTLLDVQADFSDPFVNVVILQKDRQKFNGAPEKRYLNQEVCISGVVTLRNNIPYLVLQDRQQIKVKGPVDLAEIESFAGEGNTVKGKSSTDDSQENETTVSRATERKPIEEVEIKTETIHEAKKVQPPTTAEFPGGESAFVLFLRKHITIAENSATGEQKQVVVLFDVDANGSWRNLRLITSAGKELDTKLESVLQGMPRWKPATQDGIPVASQVIYPINIIDAKKEVYSEAHNAAKALPAAQRKQPLKETLAAVQTDSLNKKPMILPPTAEKNQRPVQRNTTTHTETRPVVRENEKAEAVGRDDKTTARTNGARYKVRNKAYFHNEPDESTRRNAFIIHWNNAILTPSNEKGSFIYIVFTNHLGQVSKGWLSKQDLIMVK